VSKEPHGRPFKPFYLNLNGLINIAKNTFKRNSIKQRYTYNIREIVKRLPKISCPVKIIFVVHGKNKGLFDVGNVGSVADKFLCDALVKYKIIDEDNYKFVPRVEYIYGGVDVKNPTCDVYIYEDNQSEYSHLLRQK